MTKRSLTARPHAEPVSRVPVGPLVPVVLDECRTWLLGQGYSRNSSAGVVNLAARLSLWMQGAGVGVGSIDENLLARFVTAENSREFVCVTVKSSMSAMRRFLIDAGYLTATGADSGPATPAQVEVAQWCSWMRDQRGLTQKSIAACCYYAAGVLDLVVANGSVQWPRLEAQVLNVYIAERGRPYGVVARAHIFDAVRCRLRWALSTGRLERDLSAGILKPKGTSRGLPRGVSSEQVAALLAACDPATAIGVRDLAVLMLLVRLGLRDGEAARLSLDDIDWANGQLKVTGKGRELVLPISVDVGQALTCWLKLRPVALDRTVFVRMNAPRHSMTPSAVSAIIAKLSHVAGLEPIYTHRLRHTAAMGVLTAGGSMAEAKELLGHRYTITTMAYAKVDLASLRELVVPFWQVPR